MITLHNTTAINKDIIILKTETIITIIKDINSKIPEVILITDKITPKKVNTMMIIITKVEIVNIKIEKEIDTPLETEKEKEREITMIQDTHKNTVEAIIIIKSMIITDQDQEVKNIVEIKNINTGIKISILNLTIIIIVINNTIIIEEAVIKITMITEKEEVRVVIRLNYILKIKEINTHLNLTIIKKALLEY